MAKKPLPGEGLSDQQQATLVQLGKMMGPHATGFDQRVQEMHDEVHADEHARTDYNKVFGEAGSAKMHAAQTGGATEPLAPPMIQQQAVKGRQAGLQQAENEGDIKAAQAQTAQTQGAAPAPPSPTMPPPPKPRPAPAPPAGPPTIPGEAPPSDGQAPPDGQEGPEPEEED